MSAATAAGAADTLGPGAYRYERKFLLSGLTGPEIAGMIRLCPGHFSQIYAPRHVNNIYFDTLAFRNFFDSIDGASSRVKVRIRWYGALFGRTEAPTLELKKKQGICGAKERHGLEPFAMEPGIHARALDACLDASDLPPRVRAFVGPMRPVLVNRYRRSYWLSSCGRFRFTIDTDMSYRALFPYQNSFLRAVSTPRQTVLELKYARKDDAHASDVTCFFPFRLGKNSKYVTGIELLYRNG